MILAITRSKLEWVPVDSQRSSLGDWHVLIAADDPFTRISSSDAAVTLSRSPFHAVDLPAEEVGSFARLDFDARSLSLRRSAGAGAGLYYTFTSEGGVLCASTFGALRKLGVALEEDERRLPELFVYSYVCPPATLFRNISAVAPGEHIDISTDRGAWHVHLRTTQPLPTLRQDSAHGFDVECAAALTAAVGVIGPVASSTTVLLSGGVDSSILCELAIQHGCHQAGLGASFPFERADADIERDYATSAAAALGVPHDHYVPTSARYRIGLIEAIAAAETPLHGLQTVLLGCAFRDRLPESSCLVINGHAADTLFGTPAQKAVFDAGTPWTIERLIGGRVLDGLLWRTQERVRSPFVERLAQRRKFLRSLDDPDHFLWRLTRYGDVDWACSRFGVLPNDCWTTRQAMVARHSCESWENQTLLLGLGSMNMLQTSWARMAEVTGRAMYYPYVHPAVVGTALSIPWDQRVKEPKYQLKRAARLIGIPEFILERPKAHFGVAADRWSARGGVFEPLVRLAAGVVGEATIRQVQVPKESLARIYWNLINYAIWHRLLIRGETADQLIDELHEAEAESSATAAAESQ